MTPNELKTKLENHEDMLLIDIREPHEIEASGMIPGAKNIPMGELIVEAAQGIIPKDKKIVTICRSGARCRMVMNELGPKGYDVDLLEGGMMAWS